MQADNCFSEEGTELTVDQLRKLSCFKDDASSEDDEIFFTDCAVAVASVINTLPSSTNNLSSSNRHVSTLSIADVTTALFKEKFRMINPLLIRNACNTWPSNQSLWSIPSTFTGKMSTDEGIVLSSKDNKHFLYHELCDQVDITMTSAILNIFSQDLLDRKLYCRLYLSEHPSLLNDLNLSILAELSKSEFPPTTSNDSIVDNISNSHFALKNCGVWISSAGCVTPLHYDLCHGFLCQIGSIIYT
jgi:hypothetical protein